MTVLGVFVAEFGHRALRARDRRRFWARNWWQVLLLALPPGREAEGLARILEVVLAVYSVVVLATLAGALGAYFLDDRHRAGPQPEASAAAASNRPAPGRGAA